MLASLRNRLQFVLERFLVRGAAFRLAFVVGTVVAVSVAGGLAVVGTGRFEGLGPAIWWAFLRLSDPGYLGDDEGTYVRTVSTLLTVAGYVLFLGALIAIMTQWLQAALRRLENGLTPIADRNHIVVLGWTNRTATVVRELLLSTEQVRHFLRLRGRRSLSVVVLAEEVDAELQQDLRERVGEAWRTDSVVLRSGSPLRPEHLRRVAADDAAALILPAPLYDTPGVSPDTETIKTLLSLAMLEENVAAADLPLVVAELLDDRRLVTARRAYPGPLEVVASNALVSSLICQTIRHPGVSHVFADLLAYGEGSEIYVRNAPSLAGLRFGDLADAFPLAIMLGIVRQERSGATPMLNPSDDLVIETEDLIVFLAENYAATEPPPSYEPRRPDHGQGIPAAPWLRPHRRVLILGWSQLVPEVLAELERYRSEKFEVTVGSFVPLANRQRLLDDHEFVPQRITVEHVELDYTLPGKLRRLAPERYDNVLLMASDRIDTDETDARTIVGHLLLRELVPYSDDGPRVLVELAESENLASFPTYGSEIMVPPLMLSHIMAQVALRPELRAVFEDLFGAEGPEIYFRKAGDYGLAGREVGFSEIARAVAARNETALGVRLRDRSGHGDDEILVNPPRDRRWLLHKDDGLVILATYDADR
ncbi:MAG: ion channel DMI1 [Nannocystaceae bacterium]